MKDCMKSRTTACGAKREPERACPPLIRPCSRSFWLLQTFLSKSDIYETILGYHFKLSEMNWRVSPSYSCYVKQIVPSWKCFKGGGESWSAEGCSLFRFVYRYETTQKASRGLELGWSFFLPNGLGYCWGSGAEPRPKTCFPSVTE